MGYAWDGVCYATSAKALNAFTASVPQAGDTGVVTLNSAVINGAGLVSWSIDHYAFADGAAVTQTGTTQLPACSADLFDQIPVQSMLFTLALAFALFAGFRTGFRP